MQQPEHERRVSGLSLDGRIGSARERIGERQVGGEYLEIHDLLWKEIQNRGFSDEEREGILRAEALMYASLIDQPFRNDGRTKPWHSASVAYIVLKEMKGNARSVVKALLHDTVEDSDDLVTLDIIREMFGNRVAKSVDALTKARSAKLRTLELRTKYKILQQVAEDPEDVAIKIADRLNYWRTVIHPVTHWLVFPAWAIAKKAEETVELYVPLATALGFHDAEQELFNAAIQYLAAARRVDLRLKFSPDDYTKKLQPYQKAVEYLQDPQKTTGHGVQPLLGPTSKVRPPRFDDAYKATDGNIAEIPNADMPNILALVVNAPNVYTARSGIDLWYGRVGEVAQYFRSHGLMSEAAYEAVQEQISRRLQSIRVTDRANGIPTRFIFIRPEDDARRSATVFDVDRAAEDPAKAAHASAKSENLRHAFHAMTDPSMLTTIENMVYILNAGVVRFINVDKRSRGGRNPVGLSPDATWLDAVLSAPGWREDPTRVIGVRVYKGGSSERELWESVQEGMNMQPLTAKQDEKRTFGVDWLDMVRMPSSINRIKELLESRLEDERSTYGGRVSPELFEDEQSMHYAVLARGYRIVNALFREIAREHGFTPRDFLLSLRTAEESYHTKHPRFVCTDSGLTQYYNFLLSVGLSADNYVPNLGRTSVTDRVAEELFAQDFVLTTVRCIAPDREGELSRITELFRKRGINIIAIGNRNRPEVPTDEFVYIMIRPDDKDKLTAEDLTELHATVMTREFGRTTTLYDFDITRETPGDRNAT